MKSRHRSTIAFTSTKKGLINITLWDTISEMIWKYDKKMTNVYRGKKARKYSLDILKAFCLVHAKRNDDER